MELDLNFEQNKSIIINENREFKENDFGEN